MQILYSLELEKIKYDILYIKNDDEKKEKTNWCKRWKKSIIDNFNETNEFFIDSGEEIYNRLNKVFIKEDKFNLIAMELYLFKHYFMLSKEDKKIKNIS